MAYVAHALETLLDKSPWAWAVFFPIMGCAVCLLLGFVSGWSALAAAYPDDRSFAGETFMFRSATMRAFVGYNNCLVLSANGTGLRMRVFPLFRPGHPPAFIPWTDVVAKRQGRSFFSSTTLTFKRCPSVPLRISNGLADSLARSSHNALVVS